MDSRCMDLSLKPYINFGEKNRQRDRLSSLPNDLLIYILSLIPTKSAVVLCMLLKKRILPWITSFNLDASPISHCLRRPNKIERFSLFQTFVDSVLQAHQSPSLIRFRLNVGVDLDFCMRDNHSFSDGHSQGCLPDLKSTQINAWISFPLTRCGLRELDLCIYSRAPPGQCQLPPEIFIKETLEVLKLDVNLSFDGISIFRLPNLKTLQLYASFISEDAFVTSLVSSCPMLEELYIRAWWDHVHFTKISSPSLRRLSLTMLKLDDEDNTDLVVLDTPNLEYLLYDDNVALQYSITSMSLLEEAVIDFEFGLSRESLEVNSQQLLIFIRALSSVRRLALTGVCSRIHTDIEMKQWPVFRDLIHLELEMCDDRDIKSLTAFFYWSPNLETLILPSGLGIGVTSGYDAQWKRELAQELRKLKLETIPWCCRFNLKRIVVKRHHGSEPELIFIQFLLKYSLVLEELIVITFDPTMLESTLQNLPRASRTCSIQLQFHNSSRRRYTSIML